MMNSRPPEPQRMTTFLVIDDMENIRAQMRRNLKKLGYEGKRIQAENGVQAIEIMQEFRDHRDEVEFIICDIDMPEMNGIEFLKWTRKDDYYSKIPFLMVTTLSEVDNICEAIEAGADEYIVKPWTLEMLQERILTCWQKCNKRLET
jgi:two-component system, chemotaxis family, chemotaxis protein CheY